MMGLKTAAVTRLAKEDSRVVEALERLGVDVFPTYTPHSTWLRLFYPSADPDERVLTVTQTAGVFSPENIRGLSARCFLINASTRGEVGLDVIEALRSPGVLVAADVQGFVRTIAADGTLGYEPWPEKEQYLARIDILKTDSVEAEMLTGSKDIRTAARMIAGWGPLEVVLTHRDGVLVLADDRCFEAPFRPRKLVGRSGRGDTCIASYVAKRLSASPAESTIWAAAVTSLKMEAEGPIKRPLADVHAYIKKTTEDTN
jgi:sugar/nucleoside kinase (ribokinase family)